LYLIIVDLATRLNTENDLAIHQIRTYLENYFYINRDTSRQVCRVNMQGPGKPLSHAEINFKTEAVEDK